MQKHQSAEKWLAVILSILLTGLTIWLMTSILGNQLRVNASTHLETDKNSHLDSSELSSNRKNTLVVGGDDSNPPYSYLENGVALGLDNDLMREVANELGLDVVFNLTSLPEAKENLINGNVDIIGGVSQPDQQYQDFLFGTPYAVQYYSFFVQKNEGIYSITNLEDKKIVVLNGESIEKNLFTEGILLNQIVYTQSPVTALLGVSSGEYDGALLARYQGYYLINELHLDNLKGIGKPFRGGDYSFAVARSNRDLLNKVNQAMAVIESNGTLNEITGKWLSTFQQASFFDTNQLFIYVLIIFAAIALMIFLWGWSLKKLVTKRTSELKSSEQKYRQLINNASEGVVIVTNREIVYFNPQASAILGISNHKPEEKLTVIDFIHPSDQELVQIKYHQILEGPPANIQVKLRVLNKAGETIWIRANAIKIDWEHNPALLLFFTDITEEKKLQESIKNSEERYRLIFTQSPVGLFYFDTDFHITNINDRFAEIMGAKPEELQGFDLRSIKNSSFFEALTQVAARGNGFFEGWVKSFSGKKKHDVYGKLKTAPLVNEVQEYQGGIGLFEDLTAQVRSENKIQNLEDRFAKAFLASSDAIVIGYLKTGIIVDVNQVFVDLSGYSREEVIGKNPADLNLWVDLNDQKKMRERLEKTGACKNLEIELRNKDGEIHYALMSCSIIEINNEPCIFSITRIIDELKKNEQLIKESEIRYRSIFESVPVSIWEQDLVGVYDMLSDLRKKGVKDLKKYLNDHPDFVMTAVRSIKTIDVNDASPKIYKALTKESLCISLDKIFCPESLDNFKAELLAIWNNETYFNGDSINLDFEGNRIYVNVAIKIPKERNDFKNVLVSITDITERKKAEPALLESESRFRQLVEQVNVVVYLDYASHPSRPKYISPQIESLLGYTKEEWLSDPDLKMNIIHPEDRQRVSEEDLKTDISGEPFIIEYRAFTKDERLIWIHDEAVMVYVDGKPSDWHGVMYEITDRKMAEEALRESEIRYRTIFDSVPLSIKQEDFSEIFKMFEDLRNSGVSSLENYLQSHPDWIKKAAKKVRVTEINQETMQMYKAESKEQLLHSLDHFFEEESYVSFQKELLAFWDHQTSYEQESVNCTLTGEKIDVWISISLPAGQEDYSKVLVTILDISERKKAEEQIRTQVRYLAALHAVDMAISASMDLPITLRVLINQVHQQLMVNAVSILILDPHTQTLKYSAGIGFKTGAIENTNLRLGQSYAGQAALERRIVAADDLDSRSSQLHTREFEKEDFTHYLGVPLISKGIVKGVLELFNQTPFSEDPSWMVLLESLAGQAAIAIENSTLMEEVQKVNMNLRSAYDATIEGWARSMDARNGDTEAHSRRMSDLAVELAQAAGCKGEMLLSIRHGALLHDIGKISIPESILLKPGPLSEDEWKIMRSHPAVAKRLLSSIEHLQSATEIPYGHHERWDGLGYPEGLKGEEIPLAARVFAVIDCWDSLRSDRPWRKAWTDGNALDYIESNAGKAFDPNIVDKFKKLIGHGFSTFF